MLTKYYELLLSFLKIDSTTPHEREAALFLTHFLRDHFEYDVLDLQEVTPNRYNVLLIKGNPRVTLTSHIDTVPGYVDVVENETTIFGRGACDDKGQIITQLCALEHAVAMGLRDYACFFVVGEEVDSIGAITMMKDTRVGTPYIINGEPTDNRFVKRTRGIVEFGLTAKGTARHTSQTPLDSAIHKLVGDIGRILSVADERCSINIGYIEGGKVTNVSAAHARADFSARIEYSCRHIIEKIASCVQESTLTVTSEPIEPFELFVPEDYRSSAKVVLFSTDAAFYAGKFEHIMLFGPGSIVDAHTVDEHIEKQEIAIAAEVISNLLLRL